jgi:hypothetical protein
MDACFPMAKYYAARPRYANVADITEALALGLNHLMSGRWQVRAAIAAIADVAWQGEASVRREDSARDSSRKHALGS